MTISEAEWSRFLAHLGALTVALAKLTKALKAATDKMEDL